MFSLLDGGAVASGLAPRARFRSRHEPALGAVARAPAAIPEDEALGAERRDADEPAPATRAQLDAAEAALRKMEADLDAIGASLGGASPERRRSSGGSASSESSGRRERAALGDDAAGSTAATAPSTTRRRSRRRGARR
ncbi:hypothetical protein JL720_17 [Aureococcus anophagefferens]|nr:hypothetical protein JL720_17 [Aureococcus anophagefferens]